MEEVYIGIDDHARTCSYAVLDESGEMLLQGTVATELGRLKRVLKSLLGTRRVAIENGARASWLYQGLRGSCEEIVVANLYGMKSYKEDKNDLIDCRDLANWLRLGLVKPIYQHTTREAKRLKQAVRTYEQVRGDVVRCKNRIKAIYNSVGVGCTGDEVYYPSRRKAWLGKLKEVGHKERAEVLLKELDVLKDVKLEAESRMRRLSRSFGREYKTILSVPGIGPVFASQILGHIGNPGRIRDRWALWRMSGFAVVNRSSSDYRLDRLTGEVITERKTKTYGLNRDFNRELKRIFKTAALTAIRTNEMVKAQYFKRVESGMRPEMARLTIARKLSSSLLACWKKGEIFDENTLRQ